MTVLDRLVGAGFRRGLGGSNAWLALGIGAWGLRRLRQASRRHEELVLREVLEPGQTLVIEHQSATYRGRRP